MTSRPERAWRVLVVDDNAQDRAEARRLLLTGSDRRYAFTEADSVEQAMTAIAAASDGPPDLAFVDFYLPDGDATDLLRRITGPDGGTACPVVVMTGGEATELGRRVLRAGAQDFVGKSWMTAGSMARAADNAVTRWAMAGELRVSEALLERALVERDRLVAAIAHDLRGPLNIMVLSISVLEGQVAESVRTLPEKMHRHAMRMAKMLDELLDASQLRAGRPLDLDLRELDLVRLARDAAEELQRLAPEHSIEVSSGLSCLLGRWDALRLERVLANLLSNAVKYSPAGGVIRVTLEGKQCEGAAWAVLQVSDQGIGVAAEDHAKIFDWFGRGANARERAIAGTGIGLAGARAIVEQHGGSIVVESALEHGSTFTVKLPIAPRPQAHGSDGPLLDASRAASTGADS